MSRNQNMVLIIVAAILAVSFWLPWVTWEGTAVPGAAIVDGTFFSLSASRYSLENPFPQYAYFLYGFWSIPVFSILAILGLALKKKGGILAALAGLSALLLTTVYILFSQQLVELGTNIILPKDIAYGLYLAMAAAVLAILLAWKKNWLLKLILIIAGPMIAYGSFQLIKNAAMNEEFASTSTIEAAYTIHGEALIAEFVKNEAAAQAKYNEQVLEITGKISAVETTTDGSVNLKMENETGSYLIFTFNEGEAQKAAAYKEGDNITVRGVCSSSIFSSILEIYTISFKRCIIIK